MVAEVGVLGDGAVGAHGISGRLTGAGVTALEEFLVGGVEGGHLLHEVATVGVVAEHVVNQTDAVGTALGEVLVVQALEGAAEEFFFGGFDCFRLSRCGFDHHIDRFLLQGRLGFGLRSRIDELGFELGLGLGFRIDLADTLDEDVFLLFFDRQLFCLGLGRSVIFEKYDMTVAGRDLVRLQGDFLEGFKLVDHSGFDDEVIGVDIVNFGSLLLIVVAFLLEACGDEGDLEFVVEAVVDAGAPDDVGGAVGAVEHEVGDVADFVHLDFVVGGIGEVEEDVFGTTDVGIVEEDRGRGGGDGVDGAVLTLAGAGAHEGGAGVFHDGVDILEVDVNIATAGDDFGNTLGGREKDIIGEAESFGDVEVTKSAEFVVVDDDDGVDMLAEFLDTSFGLVAAFLAFEGEGAGNDGDDEDFLVLLGLEVDVLGYFGDDGSRASAGAAAHTGGDEEHLGVVGDGFLDVFSLVGGSFAGALRLIAGAEAEVTKRNLVGDRRGIEGLHVGVADDEVDAFDTLTVHVVDGIATTATDTNDLDVGRLVFRGVESEKRCLLGGLINEIGVILHVLVFFYLLE